MSYPIVLSFNAHDPTGGAGIAGDVVTCASLETSAFTVPTALLTGDFSQLDAVCPLDADWIDDQARTLLEDSVIHAIKIGVLPDINMVRVIAEIISDYPQLPVILAPSILVADDDEENDADEILRAIHELIIPNTHLLITQKPLLAQLAEIKHDFSNLKQHAPDAVSRAHAQAILGMGCEFVLLTDAYAPDPQVVHQLFHADGLLRSDTTSRLTDSFLGANTTLSAAITALIAHSQPTPQAVGEALEFTWQTLKKGIKMGMGKKIPDRFYWTREGEEDAEPQTKSIGKRPTPSPSTLQ
ncbi:bifunctional hydroxymethylpyrimidine kinase/phosphomethylpyrimidine kinase [Hydromonas duriensis]|uniref:Hydroxymethylpyrimidine/phosphomethylpyrimidine kinase n=1 Tax=Hydromonas duriensis TaxID=1527608 RepID=A0A4R6YBQ9_9BURK|nr:bifunctional hydroxymethylpyrimidine kinase/phosphomethylpyrimidine kinase [Hydromonas duriensis]TDR32998.1 hydroxymethylpyrimidine/phosphomethylpyrimidine kinase [Hydromonas duriensis]